MEVVRTQGQPHLRAVSARPGLTEAVSDVIVERGDDETLGVLVRNDRAALSRWASETVVERATANPELQAAVVGRRSLPLDLLNEMYFVVEGRLREHILARNASADPAAVEAALASARTRLAARAEAEPEDLAEALAEIDKLASRHRLTAPTLLGFLRSSQRTHFTVGLARLAEVEPATVRTIMDRCDLDALAVVCKAAELDKSMFLTFAVLTCGGRDAMSRAAVYGRLYAELPATRPCGRSASGASAARAARPWRLRAALITLPLTRSSRRMPGPRSQLNRWPIEQVLSVNRTTYDLGPGILGDERMIGQPVAYSPPLPFTRSARPGDLAKLRWPWSVNTSRASVRAKAASASSPASPRRSARAW